MSVVYVSTKAEADIDSIIEYTKMAWGQRQADRYLTKLEDSLELLARNPLIGRSCDAIVPGLRRYEVESHVVFYSAVSDGVLLVRMMHERMLPTKSRLLG